MLTAFLVVTVLGLTFALTIVVSAHRHDRIDLERQLAHEREMVALLTHDGRQLDDLHDSLPDVINHPAPVTAWADYVPRLLTESLPAVNEGTIDLSDEALERLFT